MQKQKGMTFIGLVLMVAGIVFIAVIGMKLIPAYLEFNAVKSALTKLTKNSDFKNMNVKELQDAYEKSAIVDNIHQVNKKDLIITPNASGGSTVAVDYQVVVPLMANVSALLDFKYSTEK